VRGAGNVHDRLTSLQRSHGNQAVTTMIQRDKKRHHSLGAASTDNPYYKKPIPAAKQADFWPSEHSSPAFAKRDDRWIEYVAKLEYENGKDKKRAALYQEELVFRHPADVGYVKTILAIRLHLLYASVDPERSAYWAKIAKGVLVPDRWKSVQQLEQENDAAAMAGKGD
jgi:hypothetical protein